MNDKNRIIATPPLTYRYLTITSGKTLKTYNLFNKPILRYAVKERDRNNSKTKTIYRTDSKWEIKVYLDTLGVKLDHKLNSARNFGTYREYELVEK